MEDRKYVIALLTFMMLGVFIFPDKQVFAYGVETHAFLTNEVINFYNKNFPDKQIPYELRNYLIDGSRREDDVPRWMNHFYDPVYDRGLSYDPRIDFLNLGEWQSSKDWAQDGNNQNSLIYKVPSTVASILTAIQQKKISVITTETDFTWQRAIKFYVQGEKEEAMFTLGHILHLLQDASVPDHTRNDPHPGDSPYENWTEQFTLKNPDESLPKKLEDINPIILNNLDFYFYELAKYSNNNFYSKDTIGIQSGYNLPILDTVVKDGDYYYGIQYGYADDIRYLSVYKNYNNSLILENSFNIALKLGDEDKVVNDYWSRLSVRSVQYCASMLDFFFREAEKIKDAQEFTMEEEESILAQAVNATKKLFAQIDNFFSGIFNTNQDFHPVTQLKLERNGFQNADQSDGDNELEMLDQQIILEEGIKRNENKDLLENQEDSRNKEKIDEKEIIKEEKQKTLQSPVKQCSFNVTQSSSHQPVIINEVAWMGTINSASDEWIELRNVFDNEINLSGWQLIDQGGQIKIFFENNDKIPANGFNILERTNDDTVMGILADKIYVGSLSNSNEGIRLFDDQCNLIDEVFANPDWPAGNSTTKQTMERKQDFSWQTSRDPNGTPKAQNSSGEIINYEEGNGSGGSSNNSGGSAQQNNQSNQIVQYLKILISEIEINPIAERFIELYNPNSVNIDLTDWYLQRKTQSSNEFDSLISKNDFEGQVIPANSYFLISRFASIFSPDIIIPDLTLTASNTIQLKNPNRELVDKVGWGEVSDFESSAALTPNDGQSLQRKFQNNTFVDTDNNAQDFEIQNCPSPKAQSRDCQLDTVQDFDIVYNPDKMELILNWQLPDTLIIPTSTITYRVEDISSSTHALPPIETISNEVSILINEIGRSYDFSIEAFSEGNWNLNIGTATISIPSFISGLFFYHDPRDNGDYLIESYYNQYPFVPDLFDENKWRVLVFYFDVDAKNDLDNSSWQPTDLTDVLAIKYNTCAGAFSKKYSLLLPDSTNYCSTAGGACNSAFSIDQLEDEHFIIQIDNLSEEMDFNESNFLTVAFYSVESVPPLNGVAPNFRLVAIDKTKYYFGEPPVHQPPHFNDGEINLDFDQQNSRLSFNWPEATDLDTLDHFLEYEIQYASSSMITNTTSTSIIVAPGEELSISVRAKDDFGNYSPALTADWFYPEPTYYITQTSSQWDLSGSYYCFNCFGKKDGGGNMNVALQSVIPESDVQFDKVLVKIKRVLGGGTANFKLSIYPRNTTNTQPDFSNPIADTILSGISGIAEDQDSTFTFSNPVSLSAGEKYWLALEVDSYTPNNWDTWQTNAWQNAAADGNPYQNGEAAKVQRNGSSYSSFSADADRDWYFKIGY